MKRLTLRKGTVIRVHDVEVTLVEDTVVTVESLALYRALQLDLAATHPQSPLSDEKDSDR